MSDPETSAVIISFFVGALAFAAWKSTFFAVAIPTVATFIVLGYIKSNRPYAGGGASFYILVQLIFTLYAYGAALAGVYMVKKLFPHKNNDDT